MTPLPACTVYFDGACPVCRREIAHYQRQRGSEAIAWVDAASCDEAVLGAGLDRAVVLSRFHVREADGTLVSGAAAFVAIWLRLPGYRWLAQLASLRPMLALLGAGYTAFLSVRRFWRPPVIDGAPARLGSEARRQYRRSGPARTRAPAGAGSGPVPGEPQ